MYTYIYICMYVCMNDIGLLSWRLLLGAGLLVGVVCRHEAVSFWQGGGFESGHGTAFRKQVGRLPWVLLGEHARDKPFPRNPPKNAKKKPKPECFETGGALLWAVTKPLPESKSEKCLGRCWTEYARAGLSRKPAKKHVQKKPKPERLSLMECIAPCKAKPLH
jgi:hypothetical protein